MIFYLKHVMNVFYITSTFISLIILRMIFVYE